MANLLFIYFYIITRATVVAPSLNFGSVSVFFSVAYCNFPIGFAKLRRTKSGYIMLAVVDSIKERCFTTDWSRKETAHNHNPNPNPNLNPNPNPKIRNRD